MPHFCMFHEGKNSLIRDRRETIICKQCRKLITYKQDGNR